jgi:hypothetical protein
MTDANKVLKQNGLKSYTTNTLAINVKKVTRTFKGINQIK